MEPGRARSGTGRRDRARLEAGRDRRRRRAGTGCRRRRHDQPRARGAGADRDQHYPCGRPSTWPTSTCSARVRRGRSRAPRASRRSGRLAGGARPRTHHPRDRCPDQHAGWNRLLRGPERAYRGGYQITSLSSRRRLPRQAPPHARDGPLVPRGSTAASLDGGPRRARRGDRLPPSLLRRPRRVRRVERLPVRRRPAVHELGLGTLRRHGLEVPGIHASSSPARRSRLPRRWSTSAPTPGWGGPAGPRAALGGRPETRLGSESDARVPRSVDQASGVPRPAKPARQTTPMRSVCWGRRPVGAIRGPVYAGATPSAQRSERVLGQPPSRREPGRRTSRLTRVDRTFRIF